MRPVIYSTLVNPILCVLTIQEHIVIESLLIKIIKKKDEISLFAFFVYSLVLFPFLQCLQIAASLYELKLMCMSLR